MGCSSLGQWCYGWVGGCLTRSLRGYYRKKGITAGRDDRPVDADSFCENVRASSRTGAVWTSIVFRGRLFEMRTIPSVSVLLSRHCAVCGTLWTELLGELEATAATLWLRSEFSTGFRSQP